MSWDGWRSLFIFYCLVGSSDRSISRSFLDSVSLARLAKLFLAAFVLPKS
ncbi:MAG: hypothetical protein SAJ37_12115 [Oscillatoria sp. PMC 1068.18]|nr:hypothetical protein [Oscillatoria sp. PMC 1076.18]MEC4989487.1 hypothetical protein [Oscillatoria sp. PMC 1068.18]